jgi:hypothetical protein
MGAGRGRLGRGEPGCGVGQPPVRAVRQFQRHPGPRSRPLLAQPLAPGAVQGEVHRPQRGRPPAPGVPERRDGGQVVAVDQDQDRAAGIVRRIGRRLADGHVAEDLGFVPVFAVQPDEDKDQEREQDHDEPGALGELHHGEQRHDQRGVDSARHVDDQLAPPARLPGPAVVAGHAEAGRGEPGGHPDGVKRDECVDGGPGHQHQAQRQHGEQHDPLEKTSRCPRLVSHRGRNESSVTKLARNGKPVKLVLPPVNKTAAVAAIGRAQGADRVGDGLDPGQ